jgi:hypothetical protein
MTMLTKADALCFIDAHAAVLDAPANPVNPFAHSEWLRHFVAEVLPAGGTVRAVEAGDGASSVMLLLPEDGSPNRWRGLANYYASLYSPLASTEVDRGAAARAVVSRLNALRPRVATINLSPLAAGDADNEHLARALADSGWYLRRYFCFGNWTLPCAGLGFTAYMATRDSQLRNTYGRKAKKFLAVGTLEICTAPQDVDAAVDAFEAVYAKSWKEPEPYPNFVRGWARRCAERGWLRLGVARLEGAPIAAQFWFTIDRRAYIFKLAYDEAHTKLSVGTVLTAHLFRHAMDVDGVVEIDYLTGDDPYKQTWMTHRRERVGLMACNLKSVAGLAVASREWAGAATKSLRARFQARAQAQAQVPA